MRLPNPLSEVDALLSAIGLRSGPNPPMTKIERRLAPLPTEEVIGWGEQSLFTIGRGLRGPDHLLADAEVNAEVLLAAIREIRRRRG